MKNTGRPKAAGPTRRSLTTDSSLIVQEYFFALFSHLNKDTNIDTGTFLSQYSISAQQYRGQQVLPLIL